MPAKKTIPGWIPVHGWADWEQIEGRAADPMVFQTSHICGVYPGRHNGSIVTRLLFVNCEHSVQESVAEVQELIAGATAQLIGRWQ